MTRRLSLLGVDASALPPDRLEPAVREVEGLIRLFADVVDAIEPPHEIALDVVLAETLDTQVDRVIKEHGRFEAVGPYRGARNAVAAHAITLRDPRHAAVRATIIIDHSYWLADVGDIPLIRAYLLIHELGHVLQQARETSADWRRHQEPLRTHEEAIRRAAVILWEEFDADMFSLSVCQRICRRADGAPLTFASTFGHGFLESAKNLLDRLCAFAQDDVQTYRRTGNGLEALYPKATSILGELMVVLAHTASAFQADQDIEGLTTALQTFRGFAAYVGDDWEVFLTELRNKDNAVAAEDNLFALIDRVLSRLGLQIEDVSEGEMFVRVVRPALCATAI